MHPENNINTSKTEVYLIDTETGEKMIMGEVIALELPTVNQLVNKSKGEYYEKDISHLID